MNKTSNASAQGCPHSASKADVTGPLIQIRTEIDGTKPAVTAAPALYSFSQVGSLATTLEWIQRFLARPHPELGRSGPVCPFVPGAIAQDTIWLGVVDHRTEDRAAIKEAIGRYRDLFLNLEPKDGDGAMMKAIVIVFPNVSTEDAGVIDDVQLELKPLFVEAGLMIGEFHERNEGEGLRNPEFRPLRSPIPSLAIRFMVESDLPFLHRLFYTPELRVSFLKSYLRRLGGELSRANFDAALSALVTAEIQMRDQGRMTEVAATSPQMHA